ncbi:MAG: hypothetical protein AAGJ35_11470, partial [Myxococcota bacterium]
MTTNQELNIRVENTLEEVEEYDLDQDIDIDDDDIYDEELEEEWSEEEFEEKILDDERSNVESFLSATTMVRCERYNANLSAKGCARKKQAPPPRVKNSLQSDEEAMQNHPCFRCVGPILINWTKESTPIQIKARTQAPVIIHPTDDHILKRE